jgi:hypothetical protein
MWGFVVLFGIYSMTIRKSKVLPAHEQRMYYSTASRHTSMCGYPKRDDHEDRAK